MSKLWVNNDHSLYFYLIGIFVKCLFFIYIKNKDLGHPSTDDTTYIGKNKRERG